MGGQAQRPAPSTPGVLGAERSLAKNFKLFSLMPLFFFEGWGSVLVGREEQRGNEVPKQNLSGLLPLAPAPPSLKGEDSEFQTRNPTPFEIDRFYPGASNRNQERGL